ncbi:DUF808 domain-containing protein [Ferrimonas aestuarii]|uniref:DUF808 domain-containing protein n=1 Tax=Ferrimonas aestuarii TaxID=2569539 RepID=A0A4U1BM73_9GAMM|nr:DUF808 domain-containing protein [Ferrimonas aestuarii]TKB54231.1 DUF808 domain-containing protein [Ferrimonas aestuarii]
MAAANLLTLLDDIASLLDDVAAMSKVAAHKTAGVLGDDLAVNAEQVSGVKADRELPVIWAVAKGSLLNKCILVPAALAISLFIPWLITPLMMLGGLFLCFEGAEKLLEMVKGGHKTAEAITDEDPKALEQRKIKGAIRTDFILSAEIIVLTLGVVATATLSTQVLTLATIAVLMTIGVYGLVAVIVKIDDAGLYLNQKPSSSAKFIGRLLLASAPKLMKSLSVIGTIAMFLVGGGILSHGVHQISEWITLASTATLELPAIGHIISGVVSTLLNGVVGIIAGFIVVAGVHLGAKLKPSQA